MPSGEGVSSSDSRRDGGPGHAGGGLNVLAVLGASLGVELAASDGLVPGNGGAKAEIPMSRADTGQRPGPAVMIGEESGSRRR